MVSLPCQMMKSFSLSAKYWIGSFAAWTVFGLANAVVSVETGSPFHLQQFLLEMLFWYTLAIGTPFVLWLAERFPIERSHLVSRLLFHFAMAGVYLLIYSGVRTLYDLIHPARPFGSDPSATFLQNYGKIFSAAIRIVHFDYWALLGIGLALDYYRRFREREKEAAALALRASQLESQLVRAQLQSLRMQLNPHFLFNTLHSIAGLVRENDKQAAIKMIAGLGDLLRQTLDHPNAQEVTLKEELEFIEKYLDIEQIRFQDRLRVHVDVEAAAYSGYVPYLILQPLVENAIRHGISRSSNASLLEIRGWLDHGKLFLQVRDDGPGVPPPAANTESACIGLKNTQARLEALYQANQRFSLENAEGGGAVATISLPYHSGAALPMESGLVS